MMAWVSLVHAGTWLPMQLSRHFENELGISLAEQDLLNQLGKVGSEIRMSELARALFLSKPGITRMVDRLEAAGLLTRVSTPGDRRAVSAKLTLKGRGLLSRSREVLVEWVEENFVRHLSEKDLRSLATSLRHLLEGLGRWEGQLEHLRGPASGLTAEES